MYALCSTFLCHPVVYILNCFILCVHIVIVLLVVADKRERLERVYARWQQRLGSTQHHIMVRYDTWQRIVVVLADVMYRIRMGVNTLQILRGSSPFVLPFGHPNI